MKKLFTIIVVAALLVACSDKNDIDTNDLEKEEPTSKTVDLWYVDPTIEVGRIDPWLVVRKQGNSIIMGEGADSAFIEKTMDFAITYSRNDFYNSEGSYPFLQGSFLSGGTIIGIGNKSGLIDPEGNVTLEPKYHYSTIDSFGTVFNIGSINYDYSINEGIEFSGGSGGCSGLFMMKDGTILYPFFQNNMHTYNNFVFSKNDLYNAAIQDGLINDGDFILLNTYASKVDLDNYKYENNLPNDLITGYMLYGKDNYKILNVSNNYVVCDYSNNVILFAKVNKSPYESLDANSIYAHQSKLYYAYEYYCDQYSYSDFTYIDEKGNTIACGYEDGYGFYEGYAAVKKNNKWGYINQNGEVVVDFIFDSVSPITDGKAWILYNGLLGRLNILDMIDNGIPITNKILDMREYTVTIKE